MPTEGLTSYAVQNLSIRDVTQLRAKKMPPMFVCSSYAMSWQLVSLICHRYQENAKVEAKILVPRRRVRADNPLALVVRQPLIFSRLCQVEVAK
jgi:hypothetical protein